MILTMKELAEYLKVSERTIQRMINNKQIQGISREKIGGQWRFNSSQIDKMFFPGQDVNDAVPLSELNHSQVAIPLSRLVNDSRIFLDMQATTMEEAITELTNPKIFNSLVLDIPDLRKKCIEREKLLNTGVGNGIALPHPRDPISTLRASGCLVIGRSIQGIDYTLKFESPNELANAPAPKKGAKKGSKEAEASAATMYTSAPADNKPIHYFFFICAQTTELHLYLMGKVAALIRDQTFLGALESAQSSTDVVRAIMAHERAEVLND